MRLCISAGDLSADFHVSLLMKELLKHDQSATFFGIGSQHMASLGAELIDDTGNLCSLGMMGYLPKLPYYLGLYRKLIRRIQDEKPDLIILVDFRFFNLNLAREIRRRSPDIPIVYYVAPVVWESCYSPPDRMAKRYSRRFKMLKECVDLSILIYPVSLDLYERFSVSYKFVGHPLMSIRRDLERKAQEVTRSPSGHSNDSSNLSLKQDSKDGKLLLLLPGSRKDEIIHNFPVILEGTRLLSEYDATLRFATAAAHPQLEGVMRSHILRSKLPVQLSKSAEVPELLSRASLVIATSGTAIHEAMIWEVPAVAVYKISRLAELFYRTVLRFRMPFYTFPNLLAGEMIVPELIQDELTGENLYEESKRLLYDTAQRERILQGYRRLLEKTVREDPLGEAAGAIFGLLNERSHINWGTVQSPVPDEKEVKT